VKNIILFILSEIGPCNNICH
jgi:hypothetical protein